MKLWSFLMHNIKFQLSFKYPIPIIFVWSFPLFNKLFKKIFSTKSYLLLIHLILGKVDYSLIKMQKIIINPINFQRYIYFKYSLFSIFFPYWFYSRLLSISRKNFEIFSKRIILKTKPVNMVSHLNNLFQIENNHQF